MKNIFFKAKHWQIFLSAFGIPFILYLFLFNSILSDISPSNTNLTVIATAYKYTAAALLIFLVVYFGWFWSVALGLQKHVPTSVPMPVKRFKTLLIIEITCNLGLLVVLYLLSSSLRSESPTSMMEVFLSVSALQIPVSILFIICRIYSIYFVAKTIKTVELERETTISDFAGEFVLIWILFPIGIWFIQPKVNKLNEDEHALYPY